MNTNEMNNSEEYYKNTWSIIDKLYGYNKGYQLVKHLIDSYNDFILTKLDNIIDGFNTIEIYYEYVPEFESFKYIMEIDINNPIISKPIIYENDGSTKIMTPMDARNRNFTYAAPLSVDMSIVCKTMNTSTGEYLIEKKKMNNINIGKIPVMVNSQYCILKIQDTIRDECNYDYGGYFVINGNEKVVISQDRIAENKTFVFINNKVSIYSHNAEIRSIQDNRFSVPKTTSLKLSSKPNQYGRYIRANIHHIKYDIPLFVLFRALGVESDKDIVKYIVYDISDENEESKILLENLVGSIEESNNVICQRDALEYLSKYLNINGYPKEMLNNKTKRLEIIKNVLTKEFLPHVGSSFEKKALYLGYMTNKLLKCYLGILPYDDRDSYINKRVDTPGILMANLFRQYYGKVIKDMKNMISKEIHTTINRSPGKLINIINKININKMVKSTIIESGLKYGLATGNWGIKNNKTKQGVAQVLNRLTFKSMISHLRRINTPIEKTGKLVQPRKLHSTQFGIICPSETPEGISVGLVKNLSIIATITIASNSTNVRSLLEEKQHNVILFSRDQIDNFGSNCKIFVNGDLIGFHKEPSVLFSTLKNYKRRGVINIQTAIVWNIIRNELWICTEAGRCIRPTFIIDTGNKLRFNKDHVTEYDKNDCEFGWMKLLIGSSSETCEDAVVEYLDVDECNNSMIAMKYSDLSKTFKGALYPVKYSHLEMDPSLLLGVLAGSISFSNHNQAPRNCYQSAMCKQAIGIYTSNFRKRYDTLGHVLNTSQKPIVQTKASKLIHCEKLPSGINAIVAIATHTGFNQEDSIIMNQSAINRGMFNTTYYRTYKEQNNKNHSTGEEEYFCKPDPTNTKLKPYNYDKLDESGFVPENTFVQSGDIIIGKCMPHKNEANSVVYKDTSICLKNNEIGFIDKNAYGNKEFTNVNGDGYSFAKVRIRSDRTPTIGDKFASNHGQKGTVGMIYRQEDMPFTREGITPDIIMNPHAIPSRMTIGQIIETIMGKACTMMGSFGDSSAFTDVSIDDITKALEDCGMEKFGNEIMYNPKTGEQVPTTIFIGPTYYQRLKHMTIDKVHSRASNGSVVMLTRQPPEGRARDGGLRLGEMEVECNWAHGIMQFLKERFMECSDNYRVFVCKKCGLISNVNPNKNIYSCKKCNNNTMFSEIRIPYASKLLFQEIETMSIGTRFIV
jgi:DNA-directed RNA polymerase II subunit RPB2